MSYQIHLLLLTGFLATQAPLVAHERPRQHTLPDDPAKAWEEVQKVMLEFWSTTCGPCIAEMPALKAAYERLHSRGFEVVAISLDDKETALRRFIQEKELPWPQHFDGKGWENTSD